MHKQKGNLWMNLSTLLPRPLGQSNSDCASIMNSLIMGIHLDRSRARSLGWRGVRASASCHPGWTCRLAGHDCIYGISFLAEKHNSDYIEGCFDLFVFPPADSPLLDKFALQALQLAISSNYGEALRDNFSQNNPALHPFRLGALYMKAPYDGNFLEFTLEAAARHQVISACGIRTLDGWLVKPGAPECDVAAFRLLLPLFSLLTATAESTLGANARIFEKTEQTNLLCSDENGHCSTWPHGKTILLSMRAAFGETRDTAKLFYPPPALAESIVSDWHELISLPARYKPTLAHNGNLPVLHVLTGFLGSGKTTFLRRWLDFLHGRERYTGVIQNEFGQVDLDSGILKDDTLVEALDDGCVCCSLADSLRPGIERIVTAMPARQFILETTGVANPANILESLKELSDLVRPGLIITVVDALDFEKKCQNDPDHVKGIRMAQIKKADVLILNKIDTVSEKNIDAIKKSLALLNDQAVIFTSTRGNVFFGQLDALMDSSDEGHSMPHELPQPVAADITHEAEGFKSCSVNFGEPVSKEKLRALLTACGDGIDRAKGIIEIVGEGCCVIQYAAGLLEIEPTMEPAIGLALIGANPELFPARKVDEHIHHGRLDDVAACSRVHRSHDHHH